MQTFNAVTNENYYNSTSSHYPWHCAAEASAVQMPTSLDSINDQELLRSCSDHSLTISSGQSPMLGADNYFPSVETATSGRNPHFMNFNITPDPGNDSSATKRSAGSPSSTGHSSDAKGCRVEKRQRNTEAARRYRQRKVDRVAELEEALRLMTQERDDYKLRLALSEAEAEVLRGLIGRRD
ncbi:uncharacterized protein RCC_08242 [Ramularia collo-cygni]|uniref:BZIP domain-containing protein n=1 Tax=Ramularia collo-cygni TaxID=112498 RepID=A0A2D3VLZ2_9PEZI|nr:uncharacterized protein RCC_08242 [Ramularia collo-cygni]CZT22373.1 uncharacterized protein RCC_08242 [Ramularia collo-cygni]